MPAFTYKALDSNGRFVSGELEADGPADIRRRLEGMGYVPLETAPRKAQTYFVYGFSGENMAGPLPSALVAAR